MFMFCVFYYIIFLFWVRDRRGMNVFYAFCVYIFVVGEVGRAQSREWGV